VITAAQRLEPRQSTRGLGSAWTSFSGLQVKALSGVGQNGLFSTIENVPLWELNAQAGYWVAVVVRHIYGPEDVTVLAE
jgi:hypothetical protein